MMKLIVCLKTNRFLIVKVVVEFSHRKSCGCFFRFGGRLGSNCKKLCLIDSIFATKKKNDTGKAIFRFQSLQVFPHQSHFQFAE